MIVHLKPKTCFTASSWRYIVSKEPLILILCVLIGKHLQNRMFGVNTQICQPLQAVMHSGKANKKGRCRKGLVTVFVIRVFTMGCILPCLLLPDGGTETAVPLLPWKSRKMLDIKRIDLFVDERVCFCVCSMFHTHDTDTCVCKMQIYL